MICERIPMSPDGNAYLDTYVLSPSDQIQIGWKRPAVIVCPGGAYLRTSDQEAEQVALHFNALGYHAAVLRYGCGEAARMPEPLLELARAVACFREHADAWAVDPARIGVCGFSAGGHLCAMLSTRFAYAASLLNLPVEAVRPDAAILGYPCTDLSLEMPKVPIDGFTVGAVDPVCPEASVIPLYRCALCTVDGVPRLDFSQAMQGLLMEHPTREARDALSPYLHVCADTPPSFVWTTANDDLVPSENSMRYVSALLKAGVPCEFHLFEDGHHGLSLADETVADSAAMRNPQVAAWFGLAAAWLKKRWPMA